MIIKAILILMLSFTMVPIASAQEIEDMEEDKLISIDFQRIPLGTVLRVLSIQSGRKFITDSQLANLEILLSLPDVTPDEAINALLDTYNLYYIRQGESDIYVIKNRLDGEIKHVSKLFFVNYADVEILADVLETRLSEGGSIAADVRNNALLVIDMADNVEIIGGLISQLDLPTPQILIEAKILDSELIDGVEHGVDIYDFYEEAAPERVFNQRFGMEGPNLKFAILDTGYNVNALISAITSKSNARLLNNPRVMVLNNQEAEIAIVDEIPYRTIEVTDSGDILATTEFKEVGVKILATPIVSKDGSITMNVSPEQSFQIGTTIDGFPIVKTSRVETTFRLNDGETAIIGGLIRESLSESTNKVPILGDLPIIGYLFRHFEKSNARQELTIFITARIIN